MAFSIAFASGSYREMGIGSDEAWGAITLGGFKELFVVPLHFWTKAAYERHWREALHRITGDAWTSCLITAMYDPSDANFITWWPLYRMKEEVRFQNQILFMQDLMKPFDPSNPYRFVPEYEAASEDGEKISEWSVSIDEIREFLG